MNSISVREIIRDTIAEEMRLDPKIFLLGEEVGEYQGAYKVSQGLLDEFGSKRVVDTPITEAGFTGLAIGAAMNGLRPIVEFMTWNFAMQAIDHIINSAAKTFYMSGGKINIPIVFRGPNGIASRVAAQHSQDYSSWYSHIPGLKVLSPYDVTDASGLLKAAIKDNNPVIFLEHELLYNEKFVLDSKEETISIGKAKVMKKGSDVTIISYSRGLEIAIETGKILAQENVDAEILNLRTLKPIDKDTIINSVKKTNKVVVIEEGWSQSGVAAEVISIIVENVFDYLDTEPLRFSGKDIPLPYAENLEKLALPSANSIVKKCLEIC
ncbi:MAG: pyruvate dehydrogenase complex E1 component subunit beta [Pelagibacterales bacterium]|nr:pyruvate dehydrogenase complex E1 component subunit beta [Pelagibacterales bacterium]OUU61284.1 MAG: pyruvate dehydrogenase complex E1 component subunit beta [Alphaproteobacteria bacterium TMED62]|tara:strand:+ start:203 stop:1174 length:972 start_codon:yes stop_codon:yes gene_type:complete